MTVVQSFWGLIILIVLCISGLYLITQRIGDDLNTRWTANKLRSKSFASTNKNYKDANHRMINSSTLSESKVMFLFEFSFPNSRNTCVHSPTMVFTREFFIKDSSLLRSEEILLAIKTTISNNPCGLFTFVVEKPKLARKLLTYFKETRRNLIGNLKFFWAAGGVTYDRIFLATKLSISNPKSLFVVSTADVVLPRLTNFQSELCRNMTKASLFLVSRRDAVGTTDCLAYKWQGSWDVYIGEVRLITEKVLHESWFSPHFWGVENVVAFLLADGNAEDTYNLCPYVDVLHLHSARSKSNRIRINRPENAINNAIGDIHQVCNCNALKRIPRIPDLKI